LRALLERDAPHAAQLLDDASATTVIRSRTQRLSASLSFRAVSTPAPLSSFA
jgi:hypothetical protein